MTSPWHQHASVPVHGTPGIIHHRLTADPAAVVATATAAALARLEPLVRSWGLDACCAAHRHGPPHRRPRRGRCRAAALVG